MKEYPASLRPAFCPAHPGALLREIIAATGKSKVEIAKLLGISRQQLYDILQERAGVTAATAVRLGKLFGNGAEFWARLQIQHDTWLAERDIDTSAIPTIRAA